MNNKVYLNIGCGLTAGKSWHNIDVSPWLLLNKIPFLGNLIIKKYTKFSRNIKYGNIVKKKYLMKMK